MNNFKTKFIIDVEVCVKLSAGPLHLIESSLKDVLKQYLEEKKDFPFNKTTKLDEAAIEFNELLENVDTIVQECSNANLTNDALFDFRVDVEYNFHFYNIHTRPMELEMFDTGADGDGDGGDVIPSCNHWLLPSKSFNTLWEQLFYEEGIKAKLLEFYMTALEFSRHKINTNIITCNRLVVLHGPPGTGKTSLCKALAQKLAIRTRSHYNCTHLIEINAHSLFSKWFSESGKLVLKMFTKIREIIMDPKNLVCVLIDEVESLAYARDAMGGQEPKDAMRVVNALLTELDSLKEYPNVLTLATSNLMKSIDIAFMDRADIKQYIDLPRITAIESIYHSMLMELMRVGLVSRPEPLTDQDIYYGDLTHISLGLSGRAIRKLPYRAYALYRIKYSNCDNNKIPFKKFYDMLILAVKETREEIEILTM